MASTDPPRAPAAAPGTTRGLNHAVLWVSDPDASATFYHEVLGLERGDTPGPMVFMRSPASPNDHALGLFPASGPATDTGRAPGLYHLAWEVPTLGDLEIVARRLTERGALVGASDHGVSKSLYARDPDGIEFEVMWEVPAGDRDPDAAPTTLPLDLAAELERFGRDTPGGGLTSLEGGS